MTMWRAPIDCANSCASSSSPVGRDSLSAVTPTARSPSSSCAILNTRVESTPPENATTADSARRIRSRRSFSFLSNRVIPSLTHSLTRMVLTSLLSLLTALPAHCSHCSQLTELTSLHFKQLDRVQLPSATSPCEDKDRSARMLHAQLSAVQSNVDCDAVSIQLLGAQYARLPRLRLRANELLNESGQLARHDEWTDLGLSSGSDRRIELIDETFRCFVCRRRRS